MYASILWLRGVALCRGQVGGQAAKGEQSASLERDDRVKKGEGNVRLSSVGSESRARDLPGTRSIHKLHIRGARPCCGHAGNVAPAIASAASAASAATATAFFPLPVTAKVGEKMADRQQPAAAHIATADLRRPTRVAQRVPILHPTDAASKIRSDRRADCRHDGSICTCAYGSQHTIQTLRVAGRHAGT